ncbi:MAG TPA: hypothetical protein VGR30_08255 [Candidatus Binatia bacterium]|jgi:hypothetical protein|nr:hypothetical protein [Candidatus Binatia bacterium]
MRRLGVAVGTIVAITWIIFILAASNGLERVEPSGWMIFLIGIPTYFGLGFLLIWGVDRVAAGFRQDIRD